MAIPIEEATKIAKDIKDQLGLETKVIGNEHEIIVTNPRDGNGAIRFNSGQFKKFVSLSGRWSVSFILYNDKPTILIW